MLGAHQHPPGPAPHLQEDGVGHGGVGMYDGGGLVVRISLRRRGGVPGVIQHPDRRVSLEIRNCRRSFSRFKRPGGEEGWALRVHGVVSGDTGAKARKLGRGRQGPGSGIRWLGQSIARQALKCCIHLLFPWWRSGAVPSSPTKLKADQQNALNSSEHRGCSETKGIVMIMKEQVLNCTQQAVRWAQNNWGS